MSGPWLGLCKLLGGEIGKQMGRKVAGDMKAFEEIPGWGHMDKIEELVTDRHLSPVYLKELIAESHSKSSLGAISEYLGNAKKSGNLSPEHLERFNNAIKSKLGQIDDSEILRSIIHVVKEKGATSMDSIADYLSHFS